MRKIVFILALCIAAGVSAVSYANKPQPRELSLVAFYNVENLYDTVPSLFYDDSDYLPQGRYQWGGERYRCKLTNLARVIDELNADVIGLCEVESEAAVRDLVMALQTDYNYIHHTGGDKRGMDLALLYKGDKFIPEESRLVDSYGSREFLYVKGELLGSRVDLIVCHLPSNFNSRQHKEKVMARLYSFAESLYSADESSCPIIMGDFNAVPADHSMKKIFNTNRKYLSGNDRYIVDFTMLAHNGYGSYAYKGRWQMLDNIMVSVRTLGESPVKYDGCGIFIRKYMLESSSGYPMRTISGGRYIGGFSDHLPIYVRLKIVTDKF